MKLKIINGLRKFLNTIKLSVPLLLLLTQLSSAQSRSPLVQNSINKWFEITIANNIVNTLDSLVQKIDRVGFDTYYNEIRTKLQQKKESSTRSQEEERWLTKFLNAMDFAEIDEIQETQRFDNWIKDTDVENVLEKTTLRDKIGKYRNIFHYDKSSRTIFKNNRSNEIIFSINEDSPIAKNLIYYTEIINRIFTHSYKFYREKTINNINKAHKKWTNFDINIRKELFPWEIWINGKWNNGTLRQPPTKIYRLMHFSYGVLFRAKNSIKDFQVKNNERLILEPFGIRFYDKKTFDAKFGISFCAVIKDNQNERHGYGALVTYSKFNLGLVFQDIEGSNDDYNIILGINLAQFISTNKDKFYKIKTNYLQNVLELIK